MTEQDQSEGLRDIEHRLALLNPGQRLCLWLVSEHKSSKEIARQLGISRHTVDQRIRFALKTLGVRRRSQAARLLRTGMPRHHRSRAMLPFAIGGHSHNDMTILTRLFWIAGISIVTAFTTGMLLAAAEAWAALFD